MNRPLETTFWMRFSRFIKGVFLYNTIYWRRASDDLEIQRMSREERAALRPKRNFEIIRPREQPRPSAAIISLPIDSSLPIASRARTFHSNAEAGAEDALEAGNAGSEVEIRRRRKRRKSRHSKVMPKQYYDQHGSGNKIFSWLFGK